MLHQARSGSQYGAFPNPKWNVRLLRSTSDRNVVSQVWGKRLSSGFPWWLAIMARSSFFLHFRHQLSCPSGQVCFLLLTTCPPLPSFTFLSETWVLAKTQVAVRWGWEPACWLFSEQSREREQKRCLTEICFEVFNPDCWSEVVSLALHGADLKYRLAVVAQKNLEMLVAALIWSNTTLEKNASTNAQKTAAMQEGEC